MTDLPTPGHLALDLSPEQQASLCRICQVWLKWPYQYPPDPAYALARELLQLMEGKNE